MAAISPALSTAWLTNAQENAVSGQVANPVYPGPITSDHAGGAETVPGRAPVGGQNSGQLPVNVDDPGVSGGGGQYPEENFNGHAAPVAPFDAGSKPFTSNGAIPDTHSFDTGGVERGRAVIEPAAKGWFRRVLSGMTMDSQSYSYTPEGFRINVPAGRTDLDQYQGQLNDGYDPYLIPYSERPVFANLAYEAQALNESPDAYTPSGELPEMVATGGQGNAVYETPDDPPVTSSPATPAAAPSPPSDFDGGFF